MPGHVPGPGATSRTDPAEGIGGELAVWRGASGGPARRRQAARRRELERRRLARLDTAEPVCSPPAEPWPELYEELDRLPEPFRAAVVLCDLEGHSYEQAAGILHCPLGTVQSRLARGRERLRHRLERRGLSSAIVWIGSGTEPTAPLSTVALSPQLVASIARTAIGTLSTRGIAGAAQVLAGAEIRRQIMIRAFTGLAALMLTGLIAATTIGLALAARTDDPPKLQATETAKKADLGPIHVRVLNNEGEGAQGVAVEIRARNLLPRSFPTDAQGRGVIPRDAIGDGAVLVARRDGETLAWANIRDSRTNPPAGTKDDPILMKLLPLTHRVEGSVVDQQGKPIAGVEIELTVFPIPPTARSTS